MRGVERENGQLHVKKNHLEAECSNLREERNRLKSELSDVLSICEKKVAAAKNAEATAKHSLAAEIEKVLSNTTPSAEIIFAHRYLKISRPVNWMHC